MKETLNTVRVGLFFLLGVAVIWIVYETLQEGRLFTTEGYPIEAEFRDVKALRSGDDVRVAGVRVGRVVETRLSNGRAVATLAIDPGVQISRDSIATVGVLSLLGTNYVAIDMGQASQYLEPGDQIATRHTADLNEVFAQLGDAAGRLDALFDGIGAIMDSVAGTADEPGLVQNVNAILAENREALNASLSNIRDITDKINQGEGTLARLINDDTAYENLMAAVDEIGQAAKNASALTGDAGQMMAHIRSGQGTLGSLIYDDTISREIEAMTINLRQVSDRLAQGEGTIGRLLVDDTLYREVQALMQKAERTLDGLNEQGPITAVGVAAGALF
jgi:phospholipid/cholesterol/gamma-HCH transport system substrate-binding protein